MSALEDRIAADQATVDSAQQILDAANAQLSEDQAKLSAAQPHLSVLGEIEAFVTRIPAELQDELSVLVAKAKDLWTSL
jgi:multidrug efflux pump subunit AcrA (membrane-fusion protein)